MARVHGPIVNDGARPQGAWSWLRAMLARLFVCPNFDLTRERLQELEAGQQASDAALRSSEERLRDFAEIASDIWWETDPAHRISYLGTRAVALGSNDSQRIGRTRWEMASDTDVEQKKWEEHRALLERREPICDFVYRSDFGHDRMRYLSVSGRPRFDAAGNFLRYRGVTRDVTTEFEDRERLRQSEERLRDFVDLGSDWRWESGPDHRFTYMSTVIRMFGMNERDRIGKTREEIADDVSEQPAKWAAHRATLQRHEPFRDFVYRSTVGAEGTHYFSVSGKPVFGQSGEFLGYRGISRDVTAEHQARERMRLSESRLRDYLETASDGYWESDADHRFIFISNNRDLSAPGGGAQVGMRRIDLAADAQDDKLKWVEHYALLDRHETFRDFVYRSNSRGPDDYISVSGKPVFDAKGRFAGYRGTSRSVTASIEAEDRLREAKTAAELASAAKSSFLANMSHELRTPLNAVIGFSEMLSAGYFGALNAKQSEYVRDIQLSGNHLLLLISDLLDVAKIEAGKLALQREPIDLAEEIQSCLRLLRPRAEEGGIQMSSRSNDAVPRYPADRRAIKQVLLNLLSNAVKFTQSGGSVIVDLSPEPDDGVSIAVADTGVGIAPQDLSKIVTPFGAVARNVNLKRPNEGTGLGLPLSKSLIELHGGSLEIVSELGSGTIVTVRLPPPSRA